MSLWVCLAACGGADPGSVRVVDRKPGLTGCDPRGRVDARGKSQPEARMKLRKAARKLDADTVWIDQPVERAPAGRTKLHGLAFRCHGRPAQTAGAEALPAAGANAAAPPPAAVAPDPQAPAQPGALAEPASLEERLRELQELYEKGLITQEDYDTRRKQLLQEL